MGTILRTAAAFGYGTVYLIDCVDPYSPKVIRGSSGMCLRLNIIETGYDGLPKDAMYYIADMAGTEPKAAKEKNFGIVLGNEGQGVGPELYKLPHRVVSVPMRTGCESLNVAVAGAIIMYYNRP
jgi:TrmH family RNA methyltransferase